MKKLFINSICTIFLIALILSTLCFSNVIQASQVTPLNTSNYITPLSASTLFPFSHNKYAGLASASSNVIISKGRAQFYTGAVPLNGNYYTSISMKLQNYKSGSWKTIKSGTAKGKGLQLFSNHYYVYKGNKYRGKSEIKIYKSKGGKLLHQISITTGTKKY